MSELVTGTMRKSDYFEQSIRRISKRMPQIPSWAKAEQMENSVPQLELWKYGIIVFPDSIFSKFNQIFVRLAQQHVHSLHGKEISKSTHHTFRL